MQLIPHPRSSFPRPLAIECEIFRDVYTIAVRFTLAGRLDLLVIPETGEQLRRDDLWRHTCFEAFILPAEGEGYHEYNMAPSRAWASYRFSSYRDGMEESFIEPLIQHVEQETHKLTQLAILDFGDDEPLQGPLKVGLSAVIESSDGSKSYWALAHPDGPPDFHNRDCFVALLPPVEAP